jgi:hypothetical protein
MHAKIKVPTFRLCLCFFLKEVYAKDSLKLPEVKRITDYVYRHFKNILTEINKIQNYVVSFLATTLVLTF